MLPKKERLTSSEVREVLKGGTSLREGSISAKVLPAARGKASVVVSSKVAPTAVLRNRLRRMGYQALPHPLPHYRMIFFVQRRDFDPAAFSQLCSKLS